MGVIPREPWAHQKERLLLAFGIERQRRSAKASGCDRSRYNEPEGETRIHGDLGENGFCDPLRSNSRRRELRI
jgi:hypothetical protein